MIDLYYWGTPNGQKISIALEEMALPYRLNPINISEGEQFKAEFLAIAPNNKIPAIIDHATVDGQPIHIFESGAILQYLGRKTGLFYPVNEAKRVEVEQWLMWQMGGFGPILGQNHHFNQYAVEKIPYAIERFINETKRLYGVLNQRLADRDYIAGEYSIADMAIFPWAMYYQQQGIEIKDYPHVAEYITRLQARPAIQKALQIQV